MTTDKDKRIQVGFKFPPKLIEKLDWWSESLEMSKTQIIEESLEQRAEALDRASVHGATQKLEQMLTKSRSMVGQDLIKEMESELRKLKGNKQSEPTGTGRRGRMGRK